ncbi:arginine--tRNA ligase [Clostridium sp. CS001]|uniref:arginine--tRNA ligase n=1 Tax=Clostridium sp. CS001 TaxID=2880648 RepID=UPI001CF49AA1|nr:arginine--tRNA ligase [Clostridium sp. CS001]MCB2289260.1 arginine--tRNA ligase [Clostridium sp. CS001]
MQKLIHILDDIVKEKFEKLGYDKEYGTVTVSNRYDLSQFQCNGALPAAKKYKKAPIMIANEVMEELQNEPTFEKVFIAGPGFINITVKDSFLTRYINDIYGDKKYGCTQPEKPMTIIVDYGGANVAKPLHVGHLRAAIIGESIKRISRFQGHNVIGDVHLGDWGLQIGMVITELKRRQSELPYFDEDFKGEYPWEAPFNIKELESIYPAASKLAKEDEKAMEEARNATFELQNGREGYVALWKQIIKVSVADLKKNYGNLNVEFDLWKGESDCQKYIPKLVNYLKENNYTYESEGALVVDVAKEDDTYTVPPFIVLKSDGASLYSTTDLATIWERVNDYNPDAIIYVVDKRQGLHFEQVFRCARKSQIVKADLSLEFIGFGTMNGKDGKPFKTREGGVMKLEDLIQTIQDKVKEKSQVNNADMSSENMDSIAIKVGVSALKYGDLSNQATKNYVFDIDRFASFEGNTGPYIQYTIVRIKSILNKAQSKDISLPKVILGPSSDVERDLMLKLSKFNEVIEGSFIERAPHKICEYIFEISNIFNRFYHENRILKEENLEKRISWLNLINLTKDILETGLDLLGIETPEEM